MTEAEQRQHATDFSNYWRNKGDEKSDSQRFWIDFFQDVLGIEDVVKKIQFEKRVNVDGQTKFIDVYIPETRTLIEQKSFDKALDKQYQQSGGWMATPFQQGRRYSQFLPVDEAARFIIACNFQTFEIHDMNKPNEEPIIVQLDEVRHKLSLFDFMFNKEVKKVSYEMEVSVKAGEIVGILYDKLIKQYKNPEDENTLKSLNALCVRLVFCLYAEDAGILGTKDLFYEYLKDIPSNNIRSALKELFKVLDTKIEERDPYLVDENPKLAAFPYVNGGLFADENIEIPPFTDELKDLLLEKASEGFDWGDISPTIFGAVFESTLNPETRRSGGMHYTSIENIHKVIDPLFLNDLENEFEEIKSISVERTKNNKLRAFQQKLASLKFLDPACGSGNFLTETYISIRRLENKIISELHKGQMVFGDVINPIQVSIGQFYGIEINDFAVTVAKTALWIAESQMMKETEDIVMMSLDFLPLKSYANIIEGNSLRVDWNDVIPNNELSYIMGNPPFIGYTLQSDSQKEDLYNVTNGIANIDYVAGWYFKAKKYISNTKIKCAFVSTNSITQGEQVPLIWENLLDTMYINYAYRTFRWDSEASIKAHVYCVIIGFSEINNSDKKLIDEENNVTLCGNINPYLIDAPNIYIYKEPKPVCECSTILKGSMPNDNKGRLSNFSTEEKKSICDKYPEAEKFFRKIYGAEEYLHNKTRWCLWLKGVSASEYKNITPIMDAIKDVYESRKASKRAATQKLAEVPYLFGEIRQPEEGNYILVPRHSSENRRYIPFGFVESDIIASDACNIIPNASLYEFGILESNVHMAWMRTTSGRLEMRYRYSPMIVYNTFPWPNSSDEQKQLIEQTAQGILDARALYSKDSLADLYDELTMPVELRKAHQANDRAVMKAYGFPIKDFTEEDCVAELMKMYQKLVESDMK